jgi:hypothetical protein
MADASYAVTSFLGGELSQFAQGRFEKPDYKISLNVCLNSFPVEIGPWVRRPGTAFAGATYGGKPGRVISWAFEQISPVTLEFTDGNVCFRSGTRWLTNNDSQSVSSISTANPAGVTVTGTSPASGKRVKFANLGASCPLLQNRQFTWTNTGGTTGTIADALTGATIDGSTLGVGSLAAGATVSSIEDVITPYIGGSWSSLRMVQAETTGILLQGAVAPQALVVATPLPTTTDPVFSLTTAVFNDGPYLDPFTNGVQAVPASTTGLIQLTLQFPAYSSTTSYAVGDFVTSSAINYESLIDQNINNSPASHSAAWVAVSGGVAINNGRGFLGTDIGRLVRLYSEPPYWNAATSYAAAAVITYNPTGLPGQGTYWQSLTGGSAHVPGADDTNWELVAPGATLPSIPNFTNPLAAAGPAQWTWGKIVSLLNFIPGGISGVAQIGNMTLNGGLSAGFDGNTSKGVGASPTAIGSAVVNIGNNLQFNLFVGQDYGATSASNYAIDHITVWPTTDDGFIAFDPNIQNVSGTLSCTFTLYASNIAPANALSGTALGTTEIQVTGVFPKGVNSVLGSAPVTITSTNKTTSYRYVWVALTTNFNMNAGNPTNAGMIITLAQLQVFSATTSSDVSAGCNVEIIGPPLLYTAPIATWQLGAYSNTTGWPTCGCYASGRLWLGGAIANRFDASVSNGINGSSVNFAPTDQYGNVLASSGISYTLNEDSVNPIYWMLPDLQGIILGTQQKEILLFAPGQGGFAPNNIDSRPAGRHGCANIEPRPTEHTYVFVQRYSLKLLEYFADVFSGKFTAPNLADKAQHITRNGIAEIAYTYAATPIIWGRDNTNALFGCTYKRDTLMTSQGPTYYAWHRHALGSGRVVESITAGPSMGGNLDALTMVTNNVAAALRHVEILTDSMDELTPLGNAWFVDDAAVPSSTTTTNTGGVGYGGLTINGLWHLNGSAVSVFAGGLDCGDYAVSSGSIFVPYGDSISAGTGGGLFTAAFAATALSANQIVIGFTYNSDGQLVRPQMPAEGGFRNGPGLGKRRRFHKVAAQLVGLGMGNARNQSALQIGRDFTHLTPVIISPQVVPNQPQMSPGQTFSGIWKDTVSAESNFDGMVAWRVSRPLPAFLVAIEPMLHGTDE